jgi:hypothetical protein
MLAMDMLVARAFGRDGANTTSPPLAAAKTTKSPSISLTSSTHSAPGTGSCDPVPLKDSDTLLVIPYRATQLEPGRGTAVVLLTTGAVIMLTLVGG